MDIAEKYSSETTTVLHDNLKGIVHKKHSSSHLLSVTCVTFFPF